MSARVNRRCCVAPPPSSRPAPGRGAGCSSSTGWRPTRVHVAEPAVDAAELASGSAAGGALLCVAAVTFGKGQDVLLDALATATDLSWHCVCVGSLDREPAVRGGPPPPFAGAGLVDRVSLPGASYGQPISTAATRPRICMVLASRAETYGMVVSEALARGLPVVAADVGGVTEALGHGADGVGRGCSSRPTTLRRSARRSAPGSATPS